MEVWLVLLVVSAIAVAVAVAAAAVAAVAVRLCSVWIAEIVQNTTRQHHPVRTVAYLMVHSHWHWHWHLLHY